MGNGITVKVMHDHSNRNEVYIFWFGLEEMATRKLISD